MPGRRTRKNSKSNANKRSKTSTNDALPAPETEEAPPPPAATPSAFTLQTLFKDAKAAPERFNGYKGLADGTTTKACIRVVPPEACVDGIIDWDHPGIIYVYIDSDQDLQHLKTAVKINGAHNGFSHRLLLGIELVGISDWLGLAKESAGADADVNSGKICASDFDVKKDANDTVVLATIPQTALADSTWTPAAQGVWATALFMALSGKSLADIMLQGFWKSPDTARRYIGLLERIVGDEFALAVRKHGIVPAGRLQGSV